MVDEVLKYCDWAYRSQSRKLEYIDPRRQHYILNLLQRKLGRPGLQGTLKRESGTERIQLHLNHEQPLVTAWADYLIRTSKLLDQFIYWAYCEIPEKNLKIGMETGCHVCQVCNFWGQPKLQNWIELNWIQRNTKNLRLVPQTWP